MGGGNYMTKATFVNLQEIINDLNSKKNYQVIIQTTNLNFYTILFIKGSCHYQIQINQFDFDDINSLKKKIDIGAKTFEHNLIISRNV